MSDRCPLGYLFYGGTFCALSYEPSFKLLNDGNVVGLRFGFRAVPTSAHRDAGSNPAWERFFLNLDGTPLHRAFHVRRLCIFFQSADTRIVCTCFKRTWQFICSILFISNILLKNSLLRMLFKDCTIWMHLMCTNCVVKKLICKSCLFLQIRRDMFYMWISIATTLLQHFTKKPITYTRKVYRSSFPWH